MGLGFSGPGYSGPKESKYLFIDGGCLRSLMKDFSGMYFNNHPIELNYNMFTSEFTKVFYYDSLPVKRNEDSDAEYAILKKSTEDYFENLEMTDRFHVYLGASQRRRNRPEQKQVDIMIAIHMLQHSFHKNMHSATLLSTDSDFIPLLDALVDNGMITTLWYGDTQHCRAKKELLIAADRKIKLSIKTIYAACTTSFKIEKSIPTENIFRDKQYPAPLIQWNEPHRGSISIIKENNSFVLVCQYNVAPDHTREVTHKELKVLQHYCSDELQIQIPQQAFEVC